MNSILFILMRSIKNYLIGISKTPIYIIICLLCIITFVSFFIFNLQISAQETNINTMYIKFNLFIMFLIINILSFVRGLSKGSEIFKPEDINHFFAAPLKPYMVLIYVFIKHLKNNCIFIIISPIIGYSVGIMINASLSGFVIIIIGLILNTFIASNFAICIFIYVNKRPRRRLFLKMIALSLVVILVINVILKSQTTNGDFLLNIYQLIQSPLISFMPIAGWASSGIMSFILGEFATATFFFSLLILLGAVFFIIVYRCNYEFYGNIFTDFEMQSRQKQTRYKIVSSKRSGASLLFSKQIKEMLRSKKSIFVRTIIGIGYCLILYVFSSNVDLLGPIAIGCMVQKMMVDNKNFIWKEMSLHYIFMLPDKPFNKLIYGSMLSVIEISISNTVILIIAGILSQSSPFLIIVVALLCSTYIFMFTSIEIFLFRMTGKIIKGLILNSFRAVIVILAMFPGIVSLWIFSRLDYGAIATIIGLLVFAIWNLFVTVICYKFSKSILHNCEML